MSERLVHYSDDSFYTISETLTTLSGGDIMMTRLAALPEIRLINAALSGISYTDQND